MTNNRKNQPNKDKKKQGNQLKTVVALSGVAFQMAAITGLGAYIGYRLDQHYQNENDIYTIILTFIGFAIAMYFVLKQINSLTKD